MSKLINPGKFPIEGLPSLLKDLERDLPKVLIKDSNERESHAEARAAFQVALEATRAYAAIAAVLSQKIRPLNLDHDDAGYTVASHLEANIEALQARAVPLSEDESALLRESQELYNTLFAEGTDIFQLSHSDEWDAVERLMTRASAPETQTRIKELGLQVMYRRFVRCHELMGVAIGRKSGSANLADLSLAAFEKAFSRLIVKAHAAYDEDSEAHKQRLTLLVGSYEYQLEQHRQKQRSTRKPQTTSKATETNIGLVSD